MLAHVQSSVRLKTLVPSIQPFSPRNSKLFIVNHTENFLHVISGFRRGVYKDIAGTIGSAKTGGTAIPTGNCNSLNTANLSA